jgi:hypothetical protein
MAPSAATGPRRRLRPRLLITGAVILVVALVGGGLVLRSRGSGSNQSVTASGASNAKASAAQPFAPARDAQGDPRYVTPPAHLPAPSGAIALPAALTAPPGAQDVIRPEAANAVVRATWDLHHQALAALDVSLMAGFETGPALEVDAGRCACSGDRDPFGPANQVAVSVPHQTSYPARFFAQVATTASNQPWIAFLVFTRADARSPWMLDLFGGYAADGAEVTPPAVDGGGFLAPQTARSAVDPTTVHSLLAEYWRFSKRTGTVPSALLWEPGVWTTDFAQKLTQYHQGGVAENGLIGYYAYETDAAHDGAYAFPEGQGWQIVCSAIRMQKTFLPTAPGKRVYQDAAQHNWGKSVPPGAYRAVTDNEIAVPCIEIPPTGSGQKVRVRGAQEYADITTYS